tara:strand:+ start:873 stop:1136 length:264 start_codon:yes stop_codon:yes gene_type:complete
MIKNILSVLVFFFSILFFYFILNIYLSESEKKKIKVNRETISKNIRDDINGLPILSNNTNDVIKFNSGFENKNGKIKRNFWKLFEKK